MKPINFDLLPDRTLFAGKVTQQKLGRLGLYYGIFFLLACFILALCSSSQWHAFAMGIILPGGGFLAHASFANWQGLIHITLGIFAFGLFIGALVLWFATGNALAPVLSWFLSAVAATIMPHSTIINPLICGRFNVNATWLLPSSVALVLLCTLLLALLKQKHGAKLRLQANEYLSSAGANLASQFHSQDESIEFTLNDLKQMRFLLDRALQPLENFDGLEWIDQFQTSAVRYQLNFLGYALSMAQATHLSAFSGYLSEAQHNLILKQTDYRIWQYWQLENCWGNLQNSADPIARDNIMFTGFCATQIALFHAASGREDFCQPNSFSFNHPVGECFAYNQSLLIDKLHSGFKKSDFYLMACEPNWIYPLCNSIGSAAIKHHNPTLWQQHATDFTHHLEHEFIDLAGRFIPCRSSYTGLALPVFGGALPQALPCFFLNATLPTIALRQWLLLRPTLLKNNQLNRAAFWPIDTGNYGFSRAAAYAGLALAAKELGDNEVAKLCFEQLALENPSQEIAGVKHRENASVWAHCVEFLAKSCSKNSFQQLIGTPKKNKHPIISHVPYPDVLVAHASYQRNSLRAVFYNGTDAEKFVIHLANLLPHRAYLITGSTEQTIIANALGNATFRLLINGRTEILLKQKVTQ
ncbi:hypothetical protein [Methylotenera sp.]|uniref:linalool dehydratase/isomerase domain-containing protein n=1 Tax=Methylotenera sp. TaxID=2051956 RepID=UPI0024882BBF|nr:hypothetical protein [Methylotenera sp.]MDI1297866.1 hypothetical protein [Methylotenera sp.]